MERVELLAALATSTDEFGRVCASIDLATAVPSCPEWNLADLLWHVTEVHHFWRAMVTERPDDPSGHVRPDRPADHELLAMYRSGAENLLDALRATPADTEVWTWSADQTAGFVLRRMAHETAVHVGDAQLATGAEPTMDADLASDGIDEFLEHFAGHRSDSPPLGGSVHLHCTDVSGEWLVVDGAAGALTVSREHAKGDCAIRGPAADIAFVLWRRLPLDSLEVIGDAELAGRFVACTHLG